MSSQDITDRQEEGYCSYIYMHLVTEHIIGSRDLCDYGMSSNRIRHVYMTMYVTSCDALHLGVILVAVATVTIFLKFG